MQADGTLAMPYKVDGRYHFEGEITIFTLVNLKVIIDNLKPALLKCRCHLVLTPPLPQHLHNGCCSCKDHCTNIGSEKHAENMLGNLNTIRTAYSANLDLIGQKDYSVPELISSACRHAAACRNTRPHWKLTWVVTVYIFWILVTNVWPWACRITFAAFRWETLSTSLPVLSIFQVRSGRQNNPSIGEDSYHPSEPVGWPITRRHTFRVTPIPLPEEAQRVVENVEI